ncbi:hypothetical protein [Phreatobacter oligotrophus]|jgi:hypothetical protein|uniref:hypothetical protein n=1 Tax=Phreatobacter oligotrophus TaxID=1122261 RepID=UPI002357970C|nr:hypothetical protein [Phreatobacter oligotrophus]MBX9990624.1 hypothetical protein [Phreatobacter oligotrophus]
MERAKTTAWQALVLLVSVVAAGPGASAQSGQSTIPSSGSAAYDRLDLTTPEAALRQFLGAYRRGDYVTAFWILAPASQQAFQAHLMRFDLSKIARVSVTGAMTHAPEMIPPVNRLEQTDPSFSFAYAMQVARRLDIMPLNLAGMPEDMSPAVVPRLGTPVQLADGQVEIAMPLQAYRAPVVFRMVRSPQGRWRVQQVLPPGGHVESLPFGLPTD